MIKELSIAQGILGLIQPVARGVVERVESATEAGSESRSDFTTVMREIFATQGDEEISEEELFSALIEERLNAVKGQETREEFAKLFAEEKNARTRPDGYVPYEEAARAALKTLLESEKITKDEANSIHSLAFNGAQLDDNKEFLWDDKGGPGDPTRAVDALEAVLIKAKAALEAFESDPSTLTERPINGDYPSGRVSTVARSFEGPTKAADGPEGFLFKPVSDTTGKLVVLLPKMFTGDVADVILRDKKGNELEQGRYGGVGNGEREHYRFNRSGEEYPRRIEVVARLKNGEEKVYKIKNPALRYD